MRGPSLHPQIVNIPFLGTKWTNGRKLTELQISFHGSDSVSLCPRPRQTTQTPYRLISYQLLFSSLSLGI